MKKILILCSIITTLLSCQEVVELDLPTTEPRLVIDASIQRKYSELNEFEMDSISVVLSLTSEFYDNTPNYVDDASVFLTNLSTNTVHELEYTNLGQYTIPETDTFILEDNVTYALNIEYDNEVYEAVETSNLSAPIDELKQYRNVNETTIDGLQINTTFTDLPEPDNFYIFAFENRNYITIEDTFIDSSAPFTFEYFHSVMDDFKLEVSIWGSDQQFNNYMDAIDEIVNGTNGPFSTVPFEIRGNIVNTTDPENYPYGYFRIHETYSMEIDLVDNEDAPLEEE